MVGILFGSVFYGADRLDRKIEKIAKPYQPAIAFLANLDNAAAVQDHDIFVFFNNFGLHTKNDVRKLQSAMKILKRFAASSKASHDTQIKLNVLLHDLQGVAQFARQYAANYQSLVAYYEISAYYFYIDEQHPAIVSMLMQQHEQLGLPSMHKRGLYKFVKKIDLDLRRLTSLFTKNTTSDELVVKLNQLKRKLITLQSSIHASAEFKAQQSKTRWLKFFGVFVVPVVLFSPLIVAASLGAVAGPLYIFVPAVILYPFVSFSMAIHELKESSKYDIPVHSTSLFSWFRPSFPLFTWMPRS